MKNPSEADANPNPSGAGTTPQQILNPPDRLASAKSGDQRGDGGAISAADFSFDTDPDPRTGPVKGGTDTVADQTQEQNQQGPSPVASLRIKFDGMDEDIPADKAAIMIQQYKSIQKNQGPLLELGNQIRQQTGITDARQIAQLVATALNKMQEGQSAQTAVQETVAEAGGDPKVPPADPAAAGARQQKAEAAVRAFFEKNGLAVDPGDPVYQAFIKVTTYGDAVESLAQTFPKISERVQAFEQDTQQRQQQARLAAVDATALRVATELGINTDEHLQGFQQFVGEMSKTVPGYIEAVTGSPQSMEQALRLYHQTAAGRKALATGAVTRQNAIADAARAGGEGVAARGNAGPGVRQPADFNSQMLQDL